LHIEAPRIFTHEKAHRMATSVENKIKNDILPNSDVVVHVDAVEDDATETVNDRIRRIAADFPSIKNIHSVYLSEMAPSPASADADFDEGKRQSQPLAQKQRAVHCISIWISRWISP
jgi:hypothetical protein